MSPPGLLGSSGRRARFPGRRARLPKAAHHCLVPGRWEQAKNSTSGRGRPAARTPVGVRSQSQRPHADRRRLPTTSRCASPPTNRSGYCCPQTVSPSDRSARWRPPSPPHPSSALRRRPTNPHAGPARGAQSPPPHQPSCQLFATSSPSVHPELRSRCAPPSQPTTTLHCGGAESPVMPAPQRPATPSTTRRVAAPGGPAHPGWRGPSP